MSSTASKTRGYFTARAQSAQFRFTTTDKFFETILNGDFEANLDNWQSRGLVTIADSDEYGQVVKLGSEVSEFDFSSISQQLTFKPNHEYFLYLAYKLTQPEDLVGFDEPSFVILIDNQPIFVSSKTTNTWQVLTLPIPPTEITNLQLIAQNTGDNLKGPLLEIAYLSTKAHLEPNSNDSYSQEVASLTTLAEEEIVSISNISFLEHQSEQYLQFSQPTTKFPIFKYQVYSTMSGEQILESSLTFKTKAAGLPVSIPNRNSDWELLQFHPPLSIPIDYSQNNPYLLKALDAHGRVLATGEFALPEPESEPESE